MTALVGLGLVVGARFVDDDWGSSVMIEVGAAVVLVAPVLWMENALRRKLGEIDEALRSSATGLSAVRELLPYGEGRTAIFDELLEAIRQRAADGKFRHADIATLVSGEPEDRTVAMAVMIGAPYLVDGAAVARSISGSGNANEQYYALRAAEAGWATHLTSDQRASILAAIDQDDRGPRWISASSDRSEIARTLREAAAIHPPVQRST